MTDVDPVRRIADLFDLVADTYENVDVDFFTQIGQSVPQVQPPAVGESWLDAGCGRGAVLIPVAQRIGPTGVVTGVDISANMLGNAAREVDRLGLTHVTLLEGDVQELPVAAGTYDSVSSCLVLFFVPDPVRALISMRTALKPGGRIVVTTFGSADPRWSGVDALIRPHMPQPRPGVPQNPAESPFASDEGVADLFARAGFVDIETVRIELPIRFATPEKWFDFSWSHAQRAMWLNLDDAARQQLRTELQPELAAIAEPDGAVIYQQKVRHTLARSPS